MIEKSKKQRQDSGTRQKLEKSADDAGLVDAGRHQPAEARIFVDQAHGPAI